MMKDMSKHFAVKALVAGIIIILVRLYTTWDIWVVIGALMIIKALIMFVHPCDKKEKVKKK